jgi:hypothetical protein
VHHHSDELLDRCRVPAGARERTTERQAQLVAIAFRWPVADQQSSSGNLGAERRQFGTAELGGWARIITGAPGDGLTAFARPWHISSTRLM